MPKVVGSIVHVKPIRLQDPDPKWLLFLPNGGVIAGRSYRTTLLRSYKVLELLDECRQVVAIASPPYELVRADRFATIDVTEDDVSPRTTPDLPVGMYA